MAIYDLGQVGLNPRGAYNSATAYNRLDYVSYDGSSYIALVPNTGVEPIDPEAWMPLAFGDRAELQWAKLNPAKMGSLSHDFAGFEG